MHIIILPILSFYNLLNEKIFKLQKRTYTKMNQNELFRSLSNLNKVVQAEFEKIEFSSPLLIDHTLLPEFPPKFGKGIYRNISNIILSGYHLNKEWFKSASIREYTAKLKNIQKIETCKFKHWQDIYVCLSLVCNQFKSIRQYTHKTNHYYHLKENDQSTGGLVVCFGEINGIYNYGCSTTIPMKCAGDFTCLFHYYFYMEQAAELCMAYEEINYDDINGKDTTDVGKLVENRCFDSFLPSLKRDKVPIMFCIAVKQNVVQPRHFYHFFSCNNGLTRLVFLKMLYEQNDMEVPHVEYGKMRRLRIPKEGNDWIDKANQYLEDYKVNVLFACDSNLSDDRLSNDKVTKKRRIS